MAQPECDPTCGGHLAAAAPGRKAGGASLRHAPSWRRKGGNSQNYPGVSVTLIQCLKPTCTENTFAMIQPSTSNVSNMEDASLLGQPKVHHAPQNRQPHPFAARLVDPDVKNAWSLFTYAFAEQKLGRRHASRGYADALLDSRGVSPALHLDQQGTHKHCIGGVRHG